MKYVVFKQGETLHCVIFADHTVHSQVKCEGAVVIGGGFFSITPFGVKTFGKSESLGVSSREADAVLVEAVLTNMGIYAFLKLCDS